MLNYIGSGGHHKSTATNSNANGPSNHRSESNTRAATTTIASAPVQVCYAYEIPGIRREYTRTIADFRKHIQAAPGPQEQNAIESLIEPNPAIVASIKKPRGEPSAQEVRELLVISEATWKQMKVLIILKSQVEYYYCTNANLFLLEHK